MLHAKLQLGFWDGPFSPITQKPEGVLLAVTTFHAGFPIDFLGKPVGNMTLLWGAWQTTVSSNLLPSTPDSNYVTTGGVAMAITMDLGLHSAMS